MARQQSHEKGPNPGFRPYRFEMVAPNPVLNIRNELTGLTLIFGVGAGVGNIKTAYGARIEGYHQPPMEDTS
jgi:hypothetical protein